MKAFRLNRFLHELIMPEHRGASRQILKRCFKSGSLTAEECELVRNRDWRGMIHYGVIFFMLEKMGAVVGMSNLHIYAAMRGQPLGRSS